MNKDNIIKRYIKEIRKQLAYCDIKNEQFLSELQEEVTAFAEQTDSLSYEQLIEQFGVPSELVEDYLAEEEPDHLKKKVQFSGNIRIVASVIIVVAVLCCGCYIASLYNTYKEAKEAIIATEVIEIREDPVE